MEINFLVRRVSEWRAPRDLETDIGEKPKQQLSWLILSPKLFDVSL